MHQDGGVFQRISNAEATESETTSCGISARSFLIARASGTVPMCNCKYHLDSAWFFPLKGSIEPIRSFLCRIYSNDPLFDVTPTIHALKQLLSTTIFSSKKKVALFV